MYVVLLKMICYIFFPSENPIYNKIALNEYTKRHNHVGQYINWKICNHYDTETKDKWYDQEPLPIVDTPKVIILWDFPIKTERTMQANRPDLVIKHKQNKTCQLIGMNVSSNCNISAKEFEKLV